MDSRLRSPVVFRAGVVAVLAALAGCGDEPILSDKDDMTVTVALGDLSFYCPHPRAPERPAPPRIVRGIEAIIAIHDKDPDAIFNHTHDEERAPMSEVLEGTEEQVRWCDPRLADRLKREL
jgi:hypothetical protein